MAYGYTGWLKLLYDWQTLVTGLLALAGGFLAAGVAYLAGRRQVQAVKDQMAALLEQNEDLKRESRRNLARNSLIAIRLVSGVLSKVEDGIGSLDESLDHVGSVLPEVALPQGFRQLIQRTDLSVVWNTLGVLGRETVEGYLLLDMRLTEFASSRNFSKPAIMEDLAKIKPLVTFLRRELTKEGQAYNAILTDFSGD